MDFCEAWKWLVQMVILEVRIITLANELCPRTAESRLTTFKLFLKRVLIEWMWHFRILGNFSFGIFWSLKKISGVYQINFWIWKVEIESMSSSHQSFHQRNLFIGTLWSTLWSISIESASKFYSIKHFFLIQHEIQHEIQHDRRGHDGACKLNIIWPALTSTFTSTLEVLPRLELSTTYNHG